MILTRDAFTHRFGRRAVFGMIHLGSLPGAPLWGGSMDAVIEAAVADARAIAEAGCSGFAIENFGDRPFFKDRVPPETVAAMTRAIGEIRHEVGLPFGVNVLRNDAASALAIAAVTGAAFIRVNVHTGAMLTDQGLIEGRAAETLRLRARIAPDVAIFADHMVKHAVPLGAVDLVQSAKDLRERGLADAIIVTGGETGSAPDLVRVRTLRDALDAPLIVGSGVNAGNAATFAIADATIVGTALKVNGRVENPVDIQRSIAIVKAIKSA